MTDNYTIYDVPRDVELLKSLTRSHRYRLFDSATLAMGLPATEAQSFLVGNDPTTKSEHLLVRLQQFDQFLRTQQQQPTEQVQDMTQAPSYASPPGANPAIPPFTPAGGPQTPPAQPSFGAPQGGPPTPLAPGPVAVGPAPGHPPAVPGFTPPPPSIPSPQGPGYNGPAGNPMVPNPGVTAPTPQRSPTPPNQPSAPQQPTPGAAAAPASVQLNLDPLKEVLTGLLTICQSMNNAQLADIERRKQAERNTQALLLLALVKLYPNGVSDISSFLPWAGEQLDQLFPSVAPKG